MSDLNKIKTALISVYNKEKLYSVVSKLNSFGIKIYSTGGTMESISALGIQVEAIESLTSYPSILGGRVKTLHPKVFGGILTRRGNRTDIEQLAQYDIPEIDLVIVDLYPFEATVAHGAKEEDIIEKIDIGGISLIRGAAKNFNDVLVVSSSDQYDSLLNLLEKNDGATSLEDRRKYALEAFAVSSHYDSAIFNYFADNSSTARFRQSFNDSKLLRYGENPHQKGVFFGRLDDMFKQLHGKEISYNNLLDIDAAVNLINEYEDTTFAILKHNNACGCASREDLKDAWECALAADPVSAFGGILVTNKVVNKATAEEVSKIFFEVIIAPGYDDNALEVLKTKKNRIILLRKDLELPKKQYRSVLNGVIVQDYDSKSEQSNDLKSVTKMTPSHSQIEDLLFANRLVKQSKSNTIILARNKQLLAGGVGQTSRVDALKQAIEKAKYFKFDLKGAVMASDAFFPFVDCVEIAGREGIDCVIQPGGSVRDSDSIEYCDAHNISMVMTGFRHFKH